MMQYTYERFKNINDGDFIFYGSYIKNKINKEVDYDDIDIFVTNQDYFHKLVQKVLSNDNVEIYLLFLTDIAHQEIKFKENNIIYHIQYNNLAESEMMIFASTLDVDRLLYRNENFYVPKNYDKDVIIENIKQKSFKILNDNLSNGLYRDTFIKNLRINKMIKDNWKQKN